MGSAIGNSEGANLNKARRDELKVGGLGEDRSRQLIEGRPYKAGTTC